MDLPDLAGDVRRACRVAVDADPRFLSLAEALGELQILRRHFEHSFGSDADLVSLVGRCYDRACFALPEAANAPEDEHERIVEGLRIVAEALVDASAGLDRDLFVQYAGRASSESQMPFLQGALMGLLAELRVVPAEGLSGALAAFALQPPDVLARAGEFLDGMLASCRTSLLLGSDHLTSAIDDLLRAAEDDAFLTMLPRLRSAFRRLHERQRRTLADTVARRLGLTSAAQVTRLGASSGAAALFARIDAKAARILEEWGL